MEQLCITIEEASKISLIGLTNLRKIMNNPECPFILKIGNQKRIKVKEFKNWLSETKEI